MTYRPAAVVLGFVLAVALGGCGDDGAEIEVPEDATFCSVFSGEYRTAVNDAVPITDDRFGERTAAIVAWAEVLVDLAPPELASEAADNLSYHQAQAAVESAAEFIPGSNAMHAWANSNC